jgi:hypothetical protein
MAILQWPRFLNPQARFCAVAILNIAAYAEFDMTLNATKKGSSLLARIASGKVYFYSVLNHVPAANQSHAETVFLKGAMHVYFSIWFMGTKAGGVICRCRFGMGSEQPCLARTG